MSQETHDENPAEGEVLDLDEVDGQEAELLNAVDAVDKRVTALEAEKATLVAEKTELKDKWLRALAELENYKKRTRREIDDAVFRGQQNLLSAFLPSIDNLLRAEELARGDEKLSKGIQMVVHEFMSALGRFGVEPVPSVGQPFDPALHEALQQVDSPDHAPGVVLREWEKGYRQGDRLLRPARVVIAGPGSGGGAA